MPPVPSVLLLLHSGKHTTHSLVPPSFSPRFKLNSVWNCTPMVWCLCTGETLPLQVNELSAAWLIIKHTTRNPFSPNMILTMHISLIHFNINLLISHFLDVSLLNLQVLASIRYLIIKSENKETDFITTFSNILHILTQNLF